jgi:subtilisin-like proprotein convertase family protein
MFVCIAALWCLVGFLVPAACGATVFDSTNSLWINDSVNPPTVADRYPWQISVAGLTGVISSLNVTLRDYDHTFPSDVDILLVGPTGLSMILMSDAGGSGLASSAYLTFSDSAPDFLPEYTDPVTGTYKPTNYGGGDVFPGPAPGGPYGSTLSLFNGSNPNGTWKLFVADDESGDHGAIWRWRLEIATADVATPEPSTFALIIAGIALAAFKRRRAAF